MINILNIPGNNFSSVIINFSDVNRKNFFEENFESMSFKKGQTIYFESNTPFGLYYVSSGRIKVAKTGSDGKEQIVRIAKPGDFLGYVELLSETRYACSATALEDVTVFFIPKSDFQNLLKEDEGMSNFFLKMLCKDLMDAEIKMTDLAYKPVRGRLAEALIFLNRVYEEGKEKVAAINISREDLASMVGTAKETVIRLLSEMKEERIIVTEGRKIRILSIDGLNKINALYQ